ncbi:MAG: hypothetical protein RDV48_07660 [Candidatus Eremiobacteraeota bacterium]|nr:hypothetical protein [Candidatus Eremiobacteraeota bacterium]
MNLNKIGFWAVSMTAFLVSFITALDHLSSQGLLPQSSKCAVITWSIILLSIGITIKLLSVSERINTQLQEMKEELASSQWQLNALYLEQAQQDSLITPAVNTRFQKAASGGKVIPFPARAAGSRGF